MTSDHPYLNFLGRPFLAHGGVPHSVRDAWSMWSLDPVIIISLLITVGIYHLGWRNLVQRAGVTNLKQKRRAGLFAGGIVTLVIALVSPLSYLAEELFSIHMVQHVLLTLVVSPLLVSSFPLPALLLGLPRGARQTTGRIWRRTAWIKFVWRLLSHPLFVWFLHVGLLWLWHVPGLYQAAIENEVIHGLEHASFLGSALLFWWVVIDTYGRRRIHHGSGILYLFSAALQGGLLGALITFSPFIWYPVYGEQAAN